MEQPPAESPIYLRDLDALEDEEDHGETYLEAFEQAVHNVENFRDPLQRFRALDLLVDRVEWLNPPLRLGQKSRVITAVLEVPEILSPSAVVSLHKKNFEALREDYELLSYGDYDTVEAIRKAPAKKAALIAEYEQIVAYAENDAQFEQYRVYCEARLRDFGISL